MSTNQPRLPTMQDNNVIEVSLKEVILGIGSIIVLIIARDYAKFRRQKAIVDAAGRLITYAMNGGDIPCKESMTPESESR